MSKKAIVFKDMESKDYSRYYANTAALTFTPTEDINITFFEEYKEPDMNGEKDVLEIIRQKKCTIILNKEEALALAEIIMDVLDDEEEEEDDESNEPNK